MQGILQNGLTFRHLTACHLPAPGAGLISKKLSLSGMGGRHFAEYSLSLFYLFLSHLFLFHLLLFHLFLFHPTLPPSFLFYSFLFHPFRKPTSIERRMKLFLGELGFEEGEDFHCEYTMRLSNGSTRIFDFYFPGRRLAIECDGAYWHRNAWKDAFKDVQAEWDGIRIVRVGEDKIIKHGTETIMLLKETLKGRNPYRLTTHRSTNPI